MYIILEMLKVIDLAPSESECTIHIHIIFIYSYLVDCLIKGVLNTWNIIFFNFTLFCINTHTHKKKSLKYRFVHDLERHQADLSIMFFGLFVSFWRIGFEFTKHL